MTPELRPIPRSALRLRLGTWAYTSAKYLEWWLGRTRFARRRSVETLPHEIFAHHTPLLRRLAQTDMWMQTNKIVNLNAAIPHLDGLLFYWMTLHTPLTITERHRHSYDVFPDAGRTKPFGSGATCAYNYLDLRIENRADEIYQLRLRLDGEFLHGSSHAMHPAQVPVCGDREGSPVRFAAMGRVCTGKRHLSRGDGSRRKSAAGKNG